VSTLNDMHAELTEVLETAGYSVHREGYPFDVPATTPYIVLTPRGGGIRRYFVTAGGAMVVVEKHRVEVTIWTEGSDATAAYELYDEIADLIEYTTLAVTGFISIRREDLPQEVNSKPFVRVTGTYMLEFQRTMAVGVVTP